MYKKTIISLFFSTSVLMASNIYNTFPTDKEAFAFKKGFSLAIMSLVDGREFNLQGREESEVVFKEHLVIIDTTDLDDADKFAIQKIGFIYADSIRLNDERIVIADFERKANAVTLAKTLNRNYFNKNAQHRRAYPYERKNNERFYKEKSFFYEVANLLEEQLKNEMKVIYIRENMPKSSSPITNQVPRVQTKINPIEAVAPNLKPKQVANEQPRKPIKTELDPIEVIETPKEEVISYINKEVFFIQFIPKGRYINRYKLVSSKTPTSTDISDNDFIKQNQEENSGELIISENYITSKDKTKFFKANDGYYYKANECEVVVDFAKEN